MPLLIDGEVAITAQQLVRFGDLRVNLVAVKSLKIFGGLKGRLKTLPLGGRDSTIAGFNPHSDLHSMAMSFALPNRVRCRHSA